MAIHCPLDAVGTKDLISVLEATKPLRLRHLTLTAGTLLHFINVVSSPNEDVEHQFLRDIFRPQTMGILPLSSRSNALEIVAIGTVTALTHVAALDSPSSKLTTVTHVEFEENSLFLDTTSPFHRFPKLTHIAWTLVGEMAKEAEYLLFQNPLLHRLLNPKIHLAVIHIVEPNRNLWAKIKTRWEGYIKRRGDKWPTARWRILVDDIKWQSHWQGGDVWTRALQ
jgi:hypothetical protein